MIRFTLFCSLAFCLAVGTATVEAGTLISNSAFTGGKIDVHYCSAQNVGKKTIKTITVELINTVNVVQDSETCNDVAQSVTCQASNGADTVYCRVTFTGGKRNIRAAMYGTNFLDNEPLVVYPVE